MPRQTKADRSNAAKSTASVARGAGGAAVDSVKKAAQAVSKRTR